MEIKVALVEMRTRIEDMYKLNTELNVLLEEELAGELTRSEKYILAELRESCTNMQMHLEDGVGAFVYEEAYADRDLSKETLKKVLEMLREVKGNELDKYLAMERDLIAACETQGAVTIIGMLCDIIRNSLAVAKWRAITPFFTKLKSMNVLSKSEIAELKNDLKKE